MTKPPLDLLEEGSPLREAYLAASVLSDPEKQRRILEAFGWTQDAGGQRLVELARNLYEERTGQKWPPSLTVVPCCGKAKVSKSKGRPRRPTALTVIQGGGNTTPISRIVTYHKDPGR